MLRACLDCGRPTRGKRCDVCGNSRGYSRAGDSKFSVEFQNARARLLPCRCDNCGRKATDLHHNPPRRVLVASGVPNPDADHWLIPLCRACHAIESAKERKA